MFASTGLFKNISCPQDLDCQLLNCIFSHDINQTCKAASSDGPVYDPGSAGGIPSSDQSLLTTSNNHPSLNRPSNTPGSIVRASEWTDSSGRLSVVASTLPPLKKRRLDERTPSETNHGEPLASRTTHSFNLRDGQRTTVASLSKPASPTRDTPPKLSIVKSARRSISPPGLRGAKPKTVTEKRDSTGTALLPPATLNPRMMSKAPESHKNRLTLLNMLHQLMEAMNKKTREANEDDVTLLSAPELIRFALDEEEHIARTHQEGMYRSAITAKITRLKKMAAEDWRKYVIEKFPHKAPESVPKMSTLSTPSSVATGLSSIQEAVEILRRLRTPLDYLEGHGYVIAPPSEKDIDAARRGVQSAAGFEVCDRCGTRFQVFPGRNDEGLLTSNGSCQYHWGKIRRPPGQRADRVTGHRESSYPCCNRALGSEGCTLGPSHVFKVTDPKRLASVLQFEMTPQTTDQRQTNRAVAFDCEMGFTTLGMELIRITAVSWPQNKKLLDVLVRTQGEVLDLNTRFSGVSSEAYVSALPYDAAVPDVPDDSDDKSEEREPDPEPLRKIESPAAARQLMFDLLTPETPLIGHAIENDLNACRIMHPFIVDTVLLYPHPRGLPVRYGLKMLASKYLERSIQMGGPLGHDSKEDAIATGDLVKIKVKEEWQRLKLEGWTFKDEKLVSPDEAIK